ncbi:MAG: hypothetical protein O2816_09765 [Planctomycetota bacterium]|nr:hypothetical protein [Planctomycetota bacterium]
MARSCGIRIGPRRYEVVVLDGSPKKHKIAAFEAGEFDATAENPLKSIAATLKDVGKRLSIPKDNVGLVIDSGHAAFRRLKLPFADVQKIDQVVKYEIESELSQWNIDDVIVDYHKLGADEHSSDLLITAVPKDDIQMALDAASSGNIEPFQVELETTAMVNAAYTAEICNLDDAQLLVHIGDYSTSVVVMDAGELREMRVIHIGALTHEVIAPAAPDAGAEDAEEGAAPAALAALAPEVDPIEASRRVDQAIKRIRREVGRTLSGARTVNPIEAIYVCGLELPGLVGSTVLDVPVYVLDCFEEDSGQPVDGFGQLVVAYGAAVRELGGGLLKPSLRREELKYTGAWERIEFPLAVACLLLTTFLGVVHILQKRELGFLDVRGTRYWLESSNRFLIGNPRDGVPGHVDPPTDEMVAFAARCADQKDKDIDPINAFGRMQTLVELETNRLKRKMGQDSSVDRPQSALVGMQMVFAVLERGHKEWRPALWSLTAEHVEGRSGRDQEHIKVSMHLVFHGESVVEGTQHLESFLENLEGMSGFMRMSDVSTEPLDNEKGIEVQSLWVMVDAGVYYDELRQKATKTASVGGQ